MSLHGFGGFGMSRHGSNRGLVEGDMSLVAHWVNVRLEVGNFEIEVRLKCEQVPVKALGLFHTPRSAWNGSNDSTLEQGMSDHVTAQALIFTDGNQRLYTSVSAPTPFPARTVKQRLPP